MKAVGEVRVLELARGLRYAPGFLDRGRQAALLAAVREVLRVAPLFTPTMPRTGKKLSVAMSNCGPLGWISDRAGGYRYEARHPTTGAHWPDIPQIAQDAWQVLAEHPDPPQACLVNFYAAGARMALHQDRDEVDFTAPIVSLSLGDTCLFRFGGNERNGPTQSLKLHSGDALVIGGASRLAFHGVDRILAGTSTLLAEGGRFNLTLRRVTKASLPLSTAS